MTYWLVVPASSLKAAQREYVKEGARDRTNPDEDEKIGIMVASLDGTRLMTGTSRLTRAQMKSLKLRGVVGLKIYTQWPPPGEEDQWP